MKKILAILLALVMLLSFAACGAKNDETPTETTAETVATVEATFGLEETLPDDATIIATEAVELMTYAEYAEAELDSQVKVECYVQATQSWWDNTITVYAADADGAYFIYNMACAEEDAAKLVAGTKIVVTGYKAEWSGEVEITDATFEFVADADTYVAEAKDLTEKLGADDLIDYQNQLVAFKGMTVKEITYKNDGGDDIYVTLTHGEADYNFCVEVYLTGVESDVYKTVGELKAGDVVDVEGFLYWYEGANPHITSIAIAE